ncbi:alpha/beta hydrolase [Bradyrhizobium guangdongense]|uniref:Alpha/beta hydrolase n=1 Tax=Bradyrhizobium guangdongense TaxID=1325090 RepID=A0A410VDG9_9BRAD|nr:alpha/beta hydrolase [Bradyrhizobium guangdongense]QAU41763.1 alpha/beta hydrolase [Bradyrhizobium guangdongense]QOZ62822.1 alpha/beta hydrolase [Bradyrhizobium guangdongense]GGI24792.1 alpha/beta hydrolase [Bradyrhizobium guangdongense]
MAIQLLRGTLSLLKWGLCAVGALALALTALIATPLQRPPELRSVSDSVKGIDFTRQVALEQFQARDGTWLGYRHYQPKGPATGRGAIFIHGSSGSSGTINFVLTAELAAHGVETWALDMRGHGASGTRGDIGYVGQLEDDLVDFVAHVRKSAPDLPLTLIGHSAGAGFSLRVAATPIVQDLFVRTVLLAPYLGYDAPTNRPHSGGWANADVPRFIGLAALRKLGIDCCAQLPALAFAVPVNSEAILTPVYSDRLMRNFATRGYRLDFAATTRPITIFGGTDDEMMISENYAAAVQAIKPDIDVKLIEGINHMGIVTNPKAVNAIAEDVATRGSGQS